MNQIFVLRINSNKIRNYLSFFCTWHDDLDNACENLQQDPKNQVAWMNLILLVELHQRHSSKMSFVHLVVRNQWMKFSKYVANKFDYCAEEFFQCSQIYKLLNLIRLLTKKKILNNRKGQKKPSGLMCLCGQGKVLICLLSRSKKWEFSVWPCATSGTVTVADWSAEFFLKGLINSNKKNHYSMHK
jgi:hypothetical protein